MTIGAASSGGTSARVTTPAADAKASLGASSSATRSVTPRPVALPAPARVSTAAGAASVPSTSTPRAATTVGALPAAASFDSNVKSKSTELPTGGLREYQATLLMV